MCTPGCGRLTFHRPTHILYPMSFTTKLYTIRQCRPQTRPDNRWDSPLWTNIQPLSIDNHMGARPEHFPDTQAKICYDTDNLYVIFRVKDNHVRCVATQYADPVWQDSCVEFFFTPGDDPSNGYFNIETNACGVMLIAHQKARDTQLTPVTQADASQIEIHHSLPDTLDHEITDPVEWTLQYKLPLEILASYANVTKPAPGVVWRGNLYKCGDKTAKPHWLTWSKIDLPQPNFHQPNYFGTLIFG